MVLTVKDQFYYQIAEDLRPVMKRCRRGRFCLPSRSWPNPTA